MKFEYAVMKWKTPNFLEILELLDIFFILYESGIDVDQAAEIYLKMYMVCY